MAAALAAALVSGIAGSRPAPAAAQQVWFGAVPPFLRQHAGWPPNDWTDLFRSGASWPQGLGAIQAFLVPTQFMTRSSDEEITAVLSGLRRHHVALAMAGLMLSGGSNGCGRGVEGYTGPRDIELAALRIRKLGGVLQYIAMDEPLFFGHDSEQRNACRDSIASVARQVAVKVKEAQRVFPNVQVGDIEPLAPMLGARWVSEMRAWFAAYQMSVGQPLAFFNVDIQWLQRSWPQQLLSVASAVRAAHLPLGIIYNTTARESSDLEWTNNAEEHFKYIESRLGIVPEYAVIESWTRRPTRMLPENTPGTMTNFLLSYLKWRRR